MIVVYKLGDAGYNIAAVIDEENGIVTGSSSVADYFRDGFQQLRDAGYEPENHMEGIKYRLYEHWRNGYYMAI